MSGLVVIVLARDSAIGIHSPELLPAHLVQHIALIAVAPALLALGHPLTFVRESSPHGKEIVGLVRDNRIVATVTYPPVALASYATVLAGTHLTGIFTLAASHPWLHELELAVHLLSGYLVAMSLLASEPLSQRRGSISGKQ